jgi:mRNA interferase MazF
MKRGELYRVAHSSSADPKKSRVFVVVSRQGLLATRFSTVICAPVYSAHEGLKHDSSIHCDALMSLPKSMLTDFVGSLSPAKIQELNQALKVALELE